MALQTEVLDETPPQDVTQEALLLALEKNKTLQHIELRDNGVADELLQTLKQKRGSGTAGGTDRADSDRARARFSSTFFNLFLMTVEHPFVGSTCA